MLLATRSLTHLMDVQPQSCAAVVQNQAVPALCAKLLSIEYIDLAEQAMQALEKLSLEHRYATHLLLWLFHLFSFLLYCCLLSSCIYFYTPNYIIRLLFRFFNLLVSTCIIAFNFSLTHFFFFLFVYLVFLCWKGVVWVRCCPTWTSSPRTCSDWRYRPPRTSADRCRTIASRWRSTRFRSSLIYWITPIRKVRYSCYLWLCKYFFVV